MRSNWQKFEGKIQKKKKKLTQTSKSRPHWALTFSIFKSLREGGIGGRVKEKVKPVSKGCLTFWIGLMNSRSNLKIALSSFLFLADIN